MTPRLPPRRLGAALAALVLAGPAWAAPATDVILSRDSPGSASTITTPSFSTAAGNELLLLFVSSDAASAGVRANSVTGAGLTWVLVQRTNVQMGTAEIWRAFAPAPLSNVSVRANLSQPVPGSITLVSFTGTDATGTNGAGAIGAVGSGNARSGAPTASLITTRNGSWVWGVGTDWDGAVHRALGDGQTMVHEFLSPFGDTYWVQRRSAPTPSSGTTVLINDAAPTGNRYNLSLVEILPPAGPTWSISGTVSPAAGGAGALVTLSGPGGGTTQADGSGAFRFPGLSDGDYVVTPAQAGYAMAPPFRNVTVAGGDVATVDFTATPLPTYVISGTITPAALGAGALVTLSGGAGRVTVADSAGTYAFPGLFDGSYMVTPGKPGFQFAPTYRSVVVSGAPRPYIDFTAQAVTGPPLNYPDLTPILPTRDFAVVGGGLAREFEYTHLTFNKGAGPLNIKAEYGPTAGEFRAYQHLYAFDGAWSLERRLPIGGVFTYHAVHGHFHFPFVVYGLYAVAPGGGIGLPVALSEKVGFCIHDSYLYDPSLPNAGDLGNLGSCTDPTSIQGLNIGAVDEYDRTDDGQSISIAGLPDGTYWFRSLVDPDNYLAESDETNNETDVRLTITGNTVQVLQTVYPVLPPLPDIALAAPLPGAAVSGTIDLVADTPAASGVQFLLNGKPLGGLVTPAPYVLPWNTTTVPNGAHWLAVQTTDANGRTNTSRVAIVNVQNGSSPDVLPPVVAVTEPGAGEVVSASVALLATVADQSPVTLQFYVDGFPWGSPIQTPPFITYWNTPGYADGPHTITASAMDAGGLASTSPPVTVTVDNSNPPALIGKDVTLSVDGAGTLSTPPFSTTTPGDFIVAFVSYDGPASGGQTASVTGAGLGWVLLKRSNAQPGTSEIWAARASGLLNGATVVSLPGTGDYHGSLTVIAFTNCAGAGVVGQASGLSGGPSIYLPGVAAGSWPFAAGNDADHAVSRTPVPGQVLVHEWVDTPVGDTFWIQSTETPRTQSGLVTLEDTAPVNDRWNCAAVEIVAARSGSANRKPVAAILSPADNSFFVLTPTSLLGSATDESPAESLSYAWSVDLLFGDGTVSPLFTGTGPSTSFVQGNYDNGTGVRERIRLVVRDPQGLAGDPAEAILRPAIDLSPSAIGVSPATPTAGQIAQYTFALSNTGPFPAPRSRWVLRDGNTVLAQGDTSVAAGGVTNLSVPAALSVGAHVLRLTADSLAVVFETNEANNVSTRSLTVAPAPGNNPPVAVASATPVSGSPALFVQFSGAASTDLDNDPLLYAWTFGDGLTGAGVTTSHSYGAVGDYTAILTVDDRRGGTDTASVVIRVTLPGFPATPVLDAFSRNGAIGVLWVDQYAVFHVASNQLAPGNSDAYIEWSGATFGPNQEAYVTLAAAAPTAREQSLMLKTQGAAWNTGHIKVAYDASGSRVNVYTFTPPGTWATRGAVTGVTFAAGDRFGARAYADGTVQIYKNASLAGTVSVAGWTYAALGGRIGLSVARAPDARFDDFGGGTIAGLPAAEDPPEEDRRLDETPPVGLFLSGGFPNPTSGEVFFSLALPEGATVRVRIFDIQGREIWREPAESRGAGTWSLRWDGRAEGGRAPAGIYFVQVQVGTTQLLRRITLLR